MRSVAIVSLLAWFTNARAEEPMANHIGDAQDFIDKLADKLANKLVDRAHDFMDNLAYNVDTHHYAYLDNTTFGKPGHLAIPPGMSALISAPYPHSSGLHSSSTFSVSRKKYFSLPRASTERDYPNDDVSRSDLIRSKLLALPLAVRLAVPFAAAFRTGAAIAVIGQPRMPRLEGPYSSIGVRIVEVSGGCRAKVFYPAESSADLANAPYCTYGRKTSDGMAGLVGFRQIGLSFLLAHLANAQSGCLQDALPASPTKIPLLIYSHGFGGNMDMATYLMRQIASFGVVVAALEHRDGTASYTEHSDGKAQPFAPGRLSGSDQLEIRAAELLAAMKPGALGNDLPIDESRVFLGGHSYGGPAALLAAAKAASLDSAPKPAGLLLHDPALGMSGRNQARMISEELGYPVLSYTSDEYDRAGVRCGTTYHVEGCFHGNFVDAALWAPPWVMRPLSTVIPAAGPGEPGELHAMLARSGAQFMHSGGKEMRWSEQEFPNLQPRPSSQQEGARDRFSVQRQRLWDKKMQRFYDEDRRLTIHG